MSRQTDYQATFQHREVVKREAWAVMLNEDSSVAQKASAALDLIGAHYGRAMAGRRGNARLSPDFNTYAQHWLWANGENILAIDVLKFLALDRGLLAKQSTRMARGQSDYAALPKKPRLTDSY